MQAKRGDVELPLLYKPISSREAELQDLHAPSGIRLNPAQSRARPGQDRMSTESTASYVVPSSLNRQQSLRLAILLTFCEPLPEHCSLLLRAVDANEWRSLLHWLDISGLALYFLDRMTELRLSNLLPPTVLSRLKENLNDNTERTRDLLDESIMIQREFQRDALTYAVLKGFSLYPSSVPRPELRHQFDMDFLVAKKSAPAAKNILERIGYGLHAVSGRSWEFKRNAPPGTPMKDFYKASPGRSVELHVEADAPDRTSSLDRIEKRNIGGIDMPVLSPVDLFLGQGLHVYKHVCSEFSRTSHLLEFRRHVMLHRNDKAFWNKLRSSAEENPHASQRLGLVVLLTTHVMGNFAPEAFTSWTVARLPESARLWVKLYGHRVVLGSFPGNKLYLLLQRELNSPGAPSRSLRQALLPHRLPPAVTPPSASDTLSLRLRRHRKQIHFVFSRLRFHVLQGLLFAWESYRWWRHRDRVTP
jgi:putative nucleotidyltransferase-like protein